MHRLLLSPFSSICTRFYVCCYRCHRRCPVHIVDYFKLSTLQAIAMCRSATTHTRYIKLQFTCTAFKRHKRRRRRKKNARTTRANTIRRLFGLGRRARFKSFVSIVDVVVYFIDFGFVSFRFVSLCFVLFDTSKVLQLIPYYD